MVYSIHNDTVCVEGIYHDLQLISLLLAGEEESNGRQGAEGKAGHYFMSRGIMYMDALEPEMAVADFEKALEYAPGDWEVHNNLGRCYIYLGEYEKAIRYFIPNTD